jgi:mannose-6-phosphate isomerase-like protein (cupin superfamily)
MLTGVADREVVTTHEGAARIANLRSGTYRARFESPDYILFEKELVLRAGQPWEFEITLNPAPARKVEAAPAPPPAPASKPAPAAPEPSGEPIMLSLTDWLDSNLIGRNEPQKDSPIGATAGAAASVFQVREDVARRSHADVDEMLYVIAGEATLRIGDRARALTPGWFVTIPRGTTYGLERRGRNPLILLSIVAPGKGAPAGPR